MYKIRNKFFLKNSKFKIHTAQDSYIQQYFDSSEIECKIQIRRRKQRAKTVKIQKKLDEFTKNSDLILENNLNLQF